MAKRKTEKKKSTELQAEFQARKLRAELEVLALREAKKHVKSQLATYQAAKVDRKTQDWKSPFGSADLAIIEDSVRLNARARQLVRDSWIARSIIRAKSRNIVGTGIMPVPAAQMNGVELTEFNTTVEALFHDWASNRNACDVEGRRTFWQMQSLCVEERCTVGELFIVWSYQRNPAFVGLKLQCFEAEQLDYEIQSCGENEVRKGIELDDFGKAVAYHFYERVPNDYLRTNPKSIRVTADHVYHYYRADRAQQSHGVSELAPVMMDIRDFSAFKDATLFRARMEACIGFAIKKNSPISTTAPPGVYPGAGESTSLTNGQRAFDMTPGMIAELQLGESIEPFIPSSPGNNYPPFTETTLRGIGAGVGLSYGAIARKSDGNYSSARQDMLEDERELGPEQDMMVDLVVKPVFELFVMLAVNEQRVDAPDFTSNRRAYVEAEYVPPSRPWIDPEKEANAAAKMIELRLKTRKEYRAQLGGRYTRTIQQIADERDQAAEFGITFPEDAEQQAAQEVEQEEKAGAGEPENETAESVVDAPAESDGGTVNTEVKADSSLNGAQITSVLEVFDKLASGMIVPDVAVELLVAVGIPRDRAVEMVNNQKSVHPPPEPEQKTPASMRSRLNVVEPPNYRKSLSGNQCVSCRWFASEACIAHAMPAESDCVCDSWEAKPEHTRKIQPPGPPEGERPFDQTSSRDLT